MINEALAFAYEAHKGQLRKDGSAYILHPVEVALELAKNGADDPLICAGLLHDVVEDAHVTREELSSRFPDETVSLVMLDSEDKSLTWEERKEQVLASLANSDDKSYPMLMCADKLCNLRCVERQLEQIGDAVWAKFNRGRDKQEWFFRGLVASLRGISNKPMYRELKNTVDRVFGDTEEKGEEA